MRENDLQTLMRLWAHLHPYRAAHAMKLRADAIRADAAGCLHDLFSGFPSGARPSFEHSAHPIREILEAALNDPELPGNASICGFAAPDRDGTWLVLAYDHRWFDSVSARHIMRCWRDRLAGRPANLPPIAPAPLRGLSAAGAATTATAYARFRKAWRTPLEDPLDFHVTWHVRTLDPHLIPALREGCRARGVTVGDALLSAIAESLGATSRPHRAGSRRDALGLAVAADLRARTPEAAPSLGVSLGWFPVLVQPEAHPDFWERAKAIAAQTRALKKPEPLAASASGLATALAFARLSRSPRNTATWFHRAMPFAAALSNVNLTGDWADAPDILDYLRASPAGPLAPAVFTPTTRSGSASIALTCRSSAASRSTAEAWLASVENQLTSAALA